MNSSNVASVAGVAGVEGPKRKPFPNRKQIGRMDAGEWIVKEVEGPNGLKRVLVDAYEKHDEAPQVQGGAKRKPFPNRKQVGRLDAGEWIVREVEGKRVFIKV
jgi:hypothetical protein